MKSALDLGLGKAKVTIEMTRDDGTVDRAVIDSVYVDGFKGIAEIEIEEEEPEITQIPPRAHHAPRRDLTLTLSGHVVESSVPLPQYAPYITVETGVQP